MDIELFLQAIAGEVKEISGVKAIVLGGSRARGTNTPTSDIDLGIYYDMNPLLDVSELAKVATELDDEHRMDLITPIGGWGPWINGGGWLRIQSLPVDFLYGDLDQLNAVIDSCLDGQVEIVYQPGHPHGFVSSIYLGEIAICRPLWDPDGVIVELKSRVLPYPSALRKRQYRKWWFHRSVGLSR